MFYQIKRYFKFKLKELENGYLTRKAKREIGRAYTTSVKIKATPVKVNFNHKIFTIIIRFLLIVTFFSASYLLKTPVTNSINAFKNYLVETKKEKLKISKKGVKNELKEKIGKTAIRKLDTLNIPETMKFYIVVNKALKKLHFLEYADNNWKTRYTFPVAIGSDPAPKQKTGDKRTPEGLYFIVGRQERSELNRIYGPLAYMLNYPNKYDLKAGRTGHGIWIHGTAPDTVPYETKGCLEMNNRDIYTLSKILIRGIATPVLIISDSSAGTPLNIPNFQQTVNDQKEIIRNFNEKENSLILFVKKWGETWSSRDINKYKLLYDSTKFKSRKMNWNAWMVYKTRTFKNYSKIEIKVKNIILSDYDTDSSAVVKFLQSYKSNKISSVNGKRLSLIRRGNKWKIYNEISINKEEILQ